MIGVGLQKKVVFFLEFPSPGVDDQPLTRSGMGLRKLARIPPDCPCEKYDNDFDTSLYPSGVIFGLVHVELQI